MSKKCAQTSAMNEILTFISKSSNLSESKLSIPKMPAPVFSLIRTEDPVEDDYQDFSQIHNNQPYEPLNSPAYKCKMLTAKKLTGANSAKQCWELTLELPEEIRVKYDDLVENYNVVIVSRFLPKMIRWNRTWFLKESETLIL